MGNCNTVGGSVEQIANRLVVGRAADQLSRGYVARELFFTGGTHGDRGPSFVVFEPVDWRHSITILRRAVACLA